MADTNTVRILDGNTFVVSEDTGDIEATPTEPTGLSRGRLALRTPAAD